jgi:hypothetical protein
MCYKKRVLGRCASCSVVCYLEQKTRLCIICHEEIEVDKEMGKRLQLFQEWLDRRVMERAS